MNTNIDNYIDSLEKWDVIEFEWDEYEFVRINEDLIVCDNLHTFTMTDFNNDLEFWENHKFGEWIVNEKQDNLQNNFNNNK